MTAMWQASFVCLAGCVLSLDGFRLLHQVLSSGAFDVLQGPEFREVSVLRAYLLGQEGGLVRLPRLQAS